VTWSGRLLAIVGLLTVVAVAPCATVLIVPSDAAAPAELEAKLPAAKAVLVLALDRHQWTRARYIGLETRAEDSLVLLMFELYGWPNVLPERAFLVSRCRAIADIEPRSMGGGVVGDFATDSELRRLRSDRTRC
jgi:hypothetical protein